MESTLEFFAAMIGLGVVALAFIIPIVAWVRARKALRQVQQNQDNWQKLTQRVYTLESQLQDMNRLKVRTEVLEQQVRDLRASGAPPAPVAPVAIPPAPPAPAPEAPATAKSTLAECTASLVASSTGASAAPPAATPPAAGASEPPSSTPPKPTSKPGITGPPYVTNIPAPGEKQSATPLHPPQFAMLGTPRPTAKETARRVLNLEEVLGTDWLNKLGVISVVIGVALFLAHEMREWGPAGKVLVGFAVSAAFLGAGIFFEHRDKWRILARAAIGGGWALTFFTTYAMYHVPPARILDSQLLDLVLLLAVAAAMVGHTLRYNSQVVTGMALLLAFTTVTISKDNVYSLSAGAILALALVFIVQQRRWYELEICGILASYFNHFYWLRPIIEPMAGHHHPFPEFMPSASLLIFYWLVFRVSYLLRRGVSEAEEKVSTVAALLNTFLLLGLMKYQSVHPEWAFRFLLALGAVEFVLGQLPIARRRRAAFVVLSVVGATLMVAAIPFKYSGETLPILWLAEAEALFLAGVFLDEIIFCRLGLLASFLVAFQLDRFALRQIYDPEWKGFHAGELLRGIMEFSATTLIFYGDAHWLGRRSWALKESRLESVILRLLSYAAGITAVIGIWWLAPEPWVAVGFAALALTLMVLGSRVGIQEFVYQGHVVAALAFLRVLVVNLGEQDIHHYTLVRLVTVALTAAMLYACARWSTLVRAVGGEYVSSGHTWTASLLMGLLAWYELKPVGVAVAWTLLGLVLFEVGRARGLRHLRMQAYLAFVFSFLRLFFVNFNAAGLPGELSPRFYTTVPLALAFFYVYGVLDSSGNKDEPQGRTAGPALPHIDVLARDRSWKAAEVLCFLGTFTLAGWARFELEADWVVAAWAAMIWALLAIAWRYEKRIFLHQGLLLGMAVLMRGTLHNFYERSYFPARFWQGRSVTVGVTVALLFASLPLAFKLRRSPDNVSPKRGLLGRIFSAFERRPEQVFFFIPFFLLTVLLEMEVPKGMVTVAWGMEAVAIFLLALVLGQRSYRLSGLGLLLVCVGKIVLIDVWGLQPRDRYLTFIVLGAALLGVSFLYTRYSEAIRKYL